MTRDRTLLSAPFPSNARLVVAVSGGSDSLGLLFFLLRELPKASKRLIVAHVHYGLRGKDSDKDQHLVHRVCRDRKIPFVSLRVRGFKEKAKREGRSVQDLARDIRYAFFQKVVQKEKAWGVVVAHHLEDQAETVMDRFLRGTGARGLSGLRPVQTLSPAPGKPTLKIWRPLLGYTKAQIQDFLRSLGVSWREDKSNQESQYRRNQIRWKVLPFLSRWNSRLPEVLSRLGDISAAEDAFLEGLLSDVERQIRGTQGRKGFHCQADRFEKIPLALKRRSIRSAAERLTEKGRGLSFDRIEEIIRLWEGKEAGPRDVGFGLSAGRLKNQAFLVLRGPKEH